MDFLYNRTVDILPTSPPPFKPRPLCPTKLMRRFRLTRSIVLAQWLLDLSTWLKKYWFDNLIGLRARCRVIYIHLVGFAFICSHCGSTVLAAVWTCSPSHWIGFAPNETPAQSGHLHLLLT
jgi:hypothetical protein